MSDTDFILNETNLVARASGALWWPDARILCVSDLHLGRSERMARLGGALIPPYETRETLERLETEVRDLNPRTVICLGDSFDDNFSVNNLDEDDRRQITNMMNNRRWIWIEGNHDPAPPNLGGSAMKTLERGPLLFRHIAEPKAIAGEVSGHYHPKAALQTRAGKISRPCFLHDNKRLILPAFGAYTGGMSADDPALRQLFGQQAFAILLGDPTRLIPLGATQTA